MSPSYCSEDMDRAQVGREIGKLAALVLMRTDGDPEDALRLLDYFDGKAPPQEDGELDAVPIAAQAIREARALVGR